MNIEKPAYKSKAVVFFARDFLAKELSLLSPFFKNYNRIYITTNHIEAKQVRSNDAEGIIFGLDDENRWKSTLVDFDLLSTAFNSDRFLRKRSQPEIEKIIQSLSGVKEAILSTYDVSFYLDEPVSGFPNWYFNKIFSNAGALCLHFQTSWLPGYMFFVEDAAQLKPVRLNLCNGTSEIVDQHFEKRRMGLGQPVYVINYGNIGRRLYDIVVTTAKAVYRLIFRRKSSYLNKDTSAHSQHVYCLMRSFFTRYSPQPSANDGLRYVILPLHYEPEAVLNYFSPFTRQEEIAEQILDTLPLGFKLILKEHPSQPGALGHSKWSSLKKSKRVISLRGDVDSKRLLNLDVCVVSIGSTLALEAAVAGCPVGVLGGVHFANMPGIRSISTPKDWLVLLDHTPANMQDIKKWYSQFIENYCFKGNIMRGKTNLIEFDKCLSSIELQRCL